MYISLIMLFVSIVLGEAITELLVKADIFLFIREYLANNPNRLFVFFYSVLSCGYCCSVWVAAILAMVFLYLNIPVLRVQAPGTLASIFTGLANILVIHRGSNYMHGIADRYFSTKKDNRYKALMR